MSTYRVQPQEMIYLMQEAGYVRPAGMTAEEFVLPEDTRPVPPKAETGSLQALALVLADPETVVRLSRWDGDGAGRLTWYYTEGDSYVRLEQRNSGVFELKTFADAGELLADATTLLPLQPVSEDF